MPPMQYVASAQLVLRLAFMIFYRAHRIGVPFNNNTIHDSLLSALQNLLGETHGAGGVGGAALGPRHRRRRGRRASVSLAVPPQPMIWSACVLESRSGVAPYHPPWSDTAGPSNWVLVALATMPPVVGPSSLSMVPRRVALAASTPAAIRSAAADVTPLANGTTTTVTPPLSTPRPLTTIAACRAAPPLRLFS